MEVLMLSQTPKSASPLCMSATQPPFPQATSRLDICALLHLLWDIGTGVIETPMSNRLTWSQDKIDTRLPHMQMGRLRQAD